MSNLKYFPIDFVPIINIFLKLSGVGIIIIVTIIKIVKYTEVTNCLNFFQPGFPNLFFLLGPGTGLGHNSVV